MNRLILFTLALSLLIVDSAMGRDPDAGFSHDMFDTVLARHVDERGMVDYVSLQQDQPLLDDYIESLAFADVSQMNRSGQLALLINAYNAFTLQLVLEYMPIDSIYDIPDGQRWTDQRWVVAGRTVSLDQLEHEIIRPVYREPRIHFALVCAARDCPPMRAEAYRGDVLDEQLEDQARKVHRGPWVNYDPQDNVLELTRLYDWYAADFLRKADSIEAYAAQYHRPLREALAADQELRIVFIEYDWSLNQSEISR